MSIFEVVGLIVLVVVSLKIAYNLAHFIYVSFIGRFLNKHRSLLGDCGRWGVVTGATDGIGKAYAKELVKLGLNVVLISRNEDKLESVASELRSLNAAVLVNTIAVDFTGGPSVYNRIRQEIFQLDIAILVNNVGMAIGIGEPLADIHYVNSLHDIINCNITSMVRMCHMVLPQMMMRHKGVIVNVGSILGNIPAQGAVLYGATKGFVDKFSMDLAAEVRSSGVIVQTLHPGLVATNMSKVTKPSIIAPSADAYAAAAIRTLGFESRTAGYWLHKIQLYFGELATLLSRTRLERNIYIRDRMQ